MESFGILSLAWMILTYLTFFDLGLGRAATKFIAERLKIGSITDLQELFWTASCINFVIGCVIGLIVAWLTPFFAEKIFHISPELIGKTKIVFYILAGSCPMLFVSTTFRGALEAAQRFEYINIVVVISNSLTFLLPVIGLLFGFDLRGIVLLLMIAKVCSVIVYLIINFKVFPSLINNMSFNFNIAVRLFSFGGWVSISNVVSPIMTYLDRFIIGSVISVTAVAYYTAPYEMITKLWILPTSLTLTLFPSFGSVLTIEQANLAGLYSRSVKILFLMIAPVVAILILFANDILTLWLGLNFASMSTAVFQILAIGILLNSLAQIPYALIQGLGRPDITAKCHLFELILYVPLVWFLVARMGIVGGALAWSTRAMLDSVLLYVASTKFVKFRLLFNNGIKRGFSVVAIMSCILLMIFILNIATTAKIVITVTTMILFCFSLWHYVLDTWEREYIIATAHNLRHNAIGKI